MPKLYHIWVRFAEEVNLSIEGADLQDHGRSSQ